MTQDQYMNYGSGSNTSALIRGRSRAVQEEIESEIESEKAEKSLDPSPVTEDIVVLGGYKVPKDNTFKVEKSTPGVRLRNTFVTVNERETAIIWLERADDSLSECWIDYRTHDGLAIQGEDYTSSTGRVLFKQGDVTPKKIEIITLDDCVVNIGEEETFYVEIYSDDDVDIVDNNIVTVNIKKV